MFRHLHASFSQKRNDDNLFPFNRYANRMVDRHQFEPPSLGLRRMFFRTREDVAPTNFAPGTVGPPDYPALLTNRLTTFQDIGRSDMAFFCGFSEVVPEGMHTQNINYDPREYKQPPLHRLPYSHKNFPPRDIHNGTTAYPAIENLQHPPSISPRRFINQFVRRTNMSTSILDI